MHSYVTWHYNTVSWCIAKLVDRPERLGTRC